MKTRIIIIIISIFLCMGCVANPYKRAVIAHALGVMAHRPYYSYSHYNPYYIPYNPYYIPYNSYCNPYDYYC